MSCQGIYDEDVYDFLVEKERAYAGIKQLRSFCQQEINRQYEVQYVREEDVEGLNIYNYPYRSIPGVYSLLSVDRSERMIFPANLLTESCISQAQNQSSLNLLGEGVIVGIVDTGINLLNEAFQFVGGGTRVGALWDQTRMQEEILEPYDGYGSVYLQGDINERLETEEGRRSLPIDENGHGSILAEIMAGTSDGIAREAELAVVKLKTSKRYLKDYYFIPTNREVYQENDIMAGIQFLVDYARSQGKPLIICMALGTNMGSHTGTSFLANFLSQVMESEGMMVVCGAGNEALRRHHYKGSIVRQNGEEEVEIQVGDGVEGFYVEAWSVIPQFFTVDVISPSGEVMESVPAQLYGEKRFTFKLENTTVEQAVSFIEGVEGEQLIVTRFTKPAPGIYRLRVSGNVVTTGIFQMWLPMEEQISGQVVFIRSNPDTTITEPGNAREPLTVGAYDGNTGGIYIQSGRGYTATERIKPELAAPTGGELVGTSVSAAVAAGAAALYMQWVAYRKNEPRVTGVTLKYGLMLGTRKNPTISYPNREWGYGELCLLNTLRL